MADIFYNTALDMDTQVTVEEVIAGEIFDFEDEEGPITRNEQACGDMGRRILANVLAIFRPDLIDWTRTELEPGLDRLDKHWPPKLEEGS